MARIGPEPKPLWRDVPREVRAGVEAALGGEVRRALRAWGGYGPTPTFRLLLADGRRAFFKAAGPADSEFARSAIGREQRVYRELSDLIAPWAPALYGSLDVDGWQVLLLEDLGPKRAPPWTRATARAVFRAYADFHRSTVGAPLPEWVPPPLLYLAGEARLWDRMTESGDLEYVAALAGERADEAMRWLAAALPALAAASRPLAEAQRPSFLHGDTRSDNLRWCDGRLRLFDWPHVGAGAAEFDLAAFAQSVTLEGGPPPEQLVAWYGERESVRPEVLDAAVAAITGFFANHCWREEIPGLPRLRPFQRAQFRVTLAWAARRLRLPSPEWLGGVRS
jgi:hypothetical protein